MAQISIDIELRGRLAVTERPIRECHIHDERTDILSREQERRVRMKTELVEIFEPSRDGLADVYGRLIQLELADGSAPIGNGRITVANHERSLQQPEGQVDQLVGRALAPHGQTLAVGFVGFRNQFLSPEDAGQVP